MFGSTPYAEASPCTIKRPIGYLISLSLDVKISPAAVAKWMLAVSIDANVYVESKLTIRDGRGIYQFGAFQNLHQTALHGSDVDASGEYRC